MLLDIEGTTSSIRFVYDVMFPYARNELDNYLQAHWNNPELTEVGELLAKDVGFESFSAWFQSREDVTDAKHLVREEAMRLMDRDVKATGLKQLQGLIWQQAFESGQMKAHVFEDVAPALGACASAALTMNAEIDKVD